MANSTATGYSATRENVIEPSEIDLVLLAKKGDVEAFNHLVLTYQDRIYSLSARILGDYDLAEDITQHTFMTAYVNLPRFRNGSFRSWLPHRHQRLLRRAAPPKKASGIFHRR